MKKMSLRRREKLDLDALEAEARAEGLGASDLRSRSDCKSQTAKEGEERAETKRRSNAYQAAFAKADEASRALRLTVHEEDDADVFAEDAKDLQKSSERATKLALKVKIEELPSGPEAIARLAMSTVNGQSLDAHNSTSGDVLENKVIFTEMEELVWCLQPNHEDVFMEEDEALKASAEKKDENELGESSTTQVKEEFVLQDDMIYEALIGKGLGGALKLCRERGFLKETIECDGTNMDRRKSLARIHEDQGPMEIHLERRDEFGLEVTGKEAYRLFCHKFHGKGPGKRKQAKRLKRYQDEQKLKQMTTSYALTESVKKMRVAQLQLKTPYLILSGNVRP